MLLCVLSALARTLGESLPALREVFAEPNLRRLELAWTGSIGAEFSYTVALAVYAYEQGGATAVGIAGIARMLPSALAAPFATTLGDRFPRDRVMVAGHIVRAAASLATAAAVFADAPIVAVYALATIVGIVSTAFWPAQAALLPALASTPERLTAANAASAMLETVGTFAGPALGGVVLALSGTEALFAATGALFALCAVLVARIDVDARPEPGAAGGSVLGEALAGFRAVNADPSLRLLVGLYSAQAFVTGALGVLVVAVALDLLDLGEPGVGFLNSAIGVGGLLGAFVAIALVRRGRLASDFGLGMVIWSAPIALVGLWPEPVPAFALLGLLGVGATLVDVTALTLLQRAVADAVLVRVCGVIESLWVGAIGVGAIAAPGLIALLGLRGALIATGLVLPVVTALLWRRLAAVDRAAAVPAGPLELLRDSPLFAPLRPSALESLAARLEPVRVEAGTEIVRQGEAGDRFYVVAEGEVEVERDGLVLNRLGPREFFGEIALLRATPRTATVRALTPVLVYALVGAEFVAAVTGHAPSAAAAEAIVGERLGGVRIASPRP
jgi:MFS family permease